MPLKYTAVHQKELTDGDGACFDVSRTSIWCSVVDVLIGLQAVRLRSATVC